MTYQDADRSRPLPMKHSPAEVDDYVHQDRAAGHEGQRPEFVTRKEHPWVNGQREATDSHFNVNHSRVEFLHAHKRIEARQYLAAERLARDHERASMPVITNSSVLVGNGASGGCADGPTQEKIDADARYNKAVQAIGRGADIVVLVVITNLTIEKAAANLGMHRQKAWGRFDLALHCLADHYRL